MPPEGEHRLLPDEIAVLAKWITDGAYWPEEDGLELAEEGADAKSGISFDPELDWALLPRRNVAPPEISDPRWSRTARSCAGMRTTYPPARPRGPRDIACFTSSSIPQDRGCCFIYGRRAPTDTGLSRRFKAIA